jgi:hypothetical protein
MDMLFVPFWCLNNTLYTDIPHFQLRLIYLFWLVNSTAIKIPIQVFIACLSAQSRIVGLYDNSEFNL